MYTRALALTRSSLAPAYLAIVVMGSIVAHLASEFFGMGAAADEVALSPKHLYLAVAALICIAVVVLQARALLRASSSRRDLKRELHVGLEALPFRGRGAFYVLTAGLQLTLGLATQIGEGCPFCSHDIAAGVLGAILTVCAMALVARAIGARLPSIAAAISEFFIAAAHDSSTRVSRRDASARTLPRFVWFSQLFNRPPPLLSV